MRRLAWAVLAACTLPAQAQFSSSGLVHVYPGAAAVPGGAGNADLGNVGLFVGNGGAGSFSAAGGSQLRVGSLQVGPSGTGNGNGTVLIDGAGTKVSLVGDGFGDGVINRLGVGEWGLGALTVSGGATLDGRAESASCLGVNHHCNNFIGNAAGSTGTLTITGAGSNASFLRFFGVGGLAVFHPPVDSFTFGTPAGTTRGTVNVLAGGKLTTDGGSLGLAPGGSSPTGRERSFADVTIAGADSLWHVTGGTLDGSAAFVSTATHRNAWATLTISDGGKLWLDGRAGVYNGVNFTSGGGRSDVRLTGAGSQMLFTGDAGVLQVGRSNGSATMSVLAGASVSGLFYLSVGRDGSNGNLLIDGAGATVRVNGTASAAANGNSGPGFVDIGRNGSGSVTVSAGGQLLVENATATTNGTGMNLGRDAASSGTLNISGAGAQVRLSTTSVLTGGGPGESQNPFVRVGRDGSGFLNINSGGKLLMEGGAASTLTDRRSTSLYIGGNSDTVNGGKGIAVVSGAGSEIRLTGQDTFIGVGIGPQSNGQFSVSDQASVSAIGMNVGRSGGVGVLKVDNASLNFSGQQTAGNLAGGFLAIGNGGGIGVATITNGSVVNLTNPGSSGAGLALGGTSTFAGGDGSLTLSGASRITVTAASGLGAATIGRDGSAFMRIRGASALDVGDGNLGIARLAGSDGTLLVSENSTVSAGWIGVGRNKTTTGDVDGGTGTLVLVNSTLSAADIVIGSNGFLGGTGTITGNVVNHGIFAPGNSPGMLEIDGAFRPFAHSRMILEVASDGAGGFSTDQVVFTSGQALDLSGLNVEFRFLGAADPNAFAPMFKLDTFFQSRQADGGTAALAPELFQSASFSAQSDAYQFSSFSFSAASGAVFTATPVPEPAGWALMLAGLLGLGSLARRRAPAGSTVAA